MFKLSSRLGSALVVLACASVVLACSVGIGHPEDQGRTVPPGGPAPTTTATAIPAFSHVFVIVLENEGADAIFHNPAAPYVNQLADHAAVATSYYAISHPSLPNYLALTAGTTNPLDGTDCSVSDTCHVAGTNTNLADEIEASGRDWVAYMDGMPTACALANAGTYAVRHNPWVYFDDIRQGDAGRCATHDLPYDPSRFAGLLASGSVPDFIWITPDLCHDGHDACGGDPIAHTDAWLAQNVPPILASPAFEQGGALFITWDEGSSDATCCGLGEGGGRVATLVVSPLARAGYQSSVPYNHYSLLRTIEDAWHLGELANSNPAVQPGVLPMSDLFHP